MSPNRDYSATVASLAGANQAWTNPANAEGNQSTVYAEINDTSNWTSNVLQATNFNFAIPIAGIIDGIYIEFLRESGGTSRANALTNQVQMVKAGSPAGTAKAGTDTWPFTTAAWVGYGSATDLWGTTWAPSDINNSNFGFGLIAQSGVASTAADALVYSMRITVYWHLTPVLVNKRVLYQVFNSAGQYLGLLPNVTSPFTYSHDINTSGTQTTITCAVSVDSAGIPVTTIDTESGNPITDESGNDLYTERTPDIAGDSSTSILFKNGNQIQIYEIDYWHPNGQLRFKGEINRWEAQIGTGNDQIKLLCYSDGSDMNNQVLTGGGTVDQSQTTENTSLNIYYNIGGAPQRIAAGQTFKVGSGITTLEAITVMLDTSGLNDSITVAVYAGNPGGALLASVTQTVNTNSPTAVTFVFSPIQNVTAGSTYFFSVVSSNPSGDTNIYYDSSTAYTSGSMYEGDESGGGSTIGWLTVTGSLYFQTLYGGNSTTVTYSSIDPSTMLLDIIDRYNGAGGRMTATSATVPLSGLSSTYIFVVASVLEGIQEALALAPPDWYWVGDLGTDVLTFQPASSATTHTLIKGKHIASINIVSTIENIVNTLYFSGGIPSGSTTNIYAIYSNQASVNAFGQRLDRQSDNRVTIQATADAIGNSSVANTSPEQYQTQVIVQYPSYDITLFKPGDMVNFAGFGTFVDKLSLQIVRVEYKTDQVTLTLGVQPPRQQIQVQQTLDGLVAEQTIANPPTPA